MSLYALFEPTDYITEVTGYSLFAESRFGSNGEMLVPDEAAGLPSDYSVEYATWDPDLSDGFDSGEVGFYFLGAMASGLVEFATWSSNCAIVHDGADDLGDIGSVLFRVAANVPGVVEFSDLAIDFYSNTELRESVSIDVDVIADSTNSSTGAAERILSVTPSASGCNLVVITGNFRMRGAADVFLSPSDLFSQILLKPAAQS